MQTPKVSILVAVYNVEKYIHRCIDSILTQTFTDFECILVNDCSPDNSGKICDDYALKDNRIRVIHKLQNEGSSQTKKTCFENSTGNYIQFVDSDDWIEPDMIEKLYNKATSENFDITMCDIFKHKKDETIDIITQKNCFAHDKINIIRHFLKKDIQGYLVNKFVSKKLLSLAFFPEYSCHEDSVVTIQNLHYANKIGVINIPLYHYCYNPQSILNSKERRAIGSIEINANWGIILTFLKKQYGQLKTFEPELSNRLNAMKRGWFFDRANQKICELIKIYPESKFYRYLFLYMVKAVIKFIIPKKLIMWLISLRKKT